MDGAASPSAKWGQTAGGIGSRALAKASVSLSSVGSNDERPGWKRKEGVKVFHKSSAAATCCVPVSLRAFCLLSDARGK